MSKKQLLKKEKPMKGSRLWGVLIFLLLILIDQITKLVADVYFVEYLGDANASGRIAIIPGVIELCMEYNRGIAFSSFADAGMPAKIAIVAGTGVLMALFAAFYFKLDKRRTFLRLALVFVVAGGIGNLIDRVYYQVWDPSTEAIIRDGVRDMVYLNIVFDFGVCNFADFFIVGGAIALVLALLFFDTDALIPLTKKYKALAKEAQEKSAEKRAKKQEEKQAGQSGENG